MRTIRGFRRLKRPQTPLFAAYSGLYGATVIAHSSCGKRMWSDTTWFMKRARSRDDENSLQQVRDLRRALNVLLRSRVWIVSGWPTWATTSA